MEVDYQFMIFMLYGCGYMFGGEIQQVQLSIATSPETLIVVFPGWGMRGQLQTKLPVNRKSDFVDISYTLNKNARQYVYVPSIHLLFGCNLAPLMFTSGMSGCKKCLPVFASFALFGIDMRTGGCRRYDSVLHIQDDGEKVRTRSEY